MTALKRIEGKEGGGHGQNMTTLKKEEEMRS